MSHLNTKEEKKLCFEYISVIFYPKENVFSKKIVNIIGPTHFGFNFMVHISDTNLKTNFFMNKIQVCKKIIKKLKI